MDRNTTTLLAICMLAATPQRPMAQNAAWQKQAIIEIEKMKGWALVDVGLPGAPVTRVNLVGTPVPAVKWAPLMKAFPRLQELSVC